MATDLTWRQAIDKVLSSSPSAMHYKEIADQIMANGLRKNLGATPAATVNAQITSSIKHDGDASPYIRVDKGTFALRSGTSVSQSDLTSKASEPEVIEEQYRIITSFGMFWRRDAIEWTAIQRLLGMQSIGATPVDFNKQLGIYLLYDGREVIYVGRTTDRSLGRRLYEHTFDRMSARLDRFSWFGLLPVSDSGQLDKLPTIYNATELIPALEAVLIEALEPRQNRKRGDDLAAVEYIQKVDPEIEKKKMKATLGAALEKL